MPTTTSSTVLAECNAVESTPEQVVYWLNLGFCAREQHDFTPGFYAYNRALSMAKTDLEKKQAEQGLTLILLTNKNVEEAKLHFKKADDLNKKHSDANFVNFENEYQQLLKNF